MQGGIYLIADELVPIRVPGLARSPLLLLAAPLLLAATCEPMPQPLTEHDGSGSLDPPSSYAAMWYEMEECTGLRRDFRSVRWFVVPTERWSGFRCASDETDCKGEYWDTSNAIYLADSRVGSKETVRHEILHALGLRHEDAEFWRCLDTPMPEKYKQKKP